MANIRVDIEFNNPAIDDYSANYTLSFNRFTGLQNYTVNNRSTADNAQPIYGLIAKTGSVEILDKDDKIYEAIQNNLNRYSFNIYIYLDNKKIGTFRGSRLLNYNIFTKEATFDLEDHLLKLQDVSVEYFYKKNRTVLDLYLYLTQIDGMYVPVKPLNDDVLNWMESIVIPFAYLDRDNVWNQLNKLCNIAQLRMYNDADGDMVVIRYD